MTIELTATVKLTLFMAPGACSRVTMNALEEARLEYDCRCVNLARFEQKTVAYLAVNPKGKVPALQVDERIVTENAAILWFLHRQRPQALLLPHGKAPADEDQGLIDLIWCAGTLHPMVRQIRAPMRYTSGDTAGVYQDGLDKFTNECRLIEQRLSGRNWWYGEAKSIVDVYVEWLGSTAAKGGFPLNDYPALVDHAVRVTAQPTFRRVLDREAAVSATW